MKKNYIIIVILFFIGIQTIKAQRNDALYFATNTPQSSFYNPAKQSDLNMYMSLPIISNFGIDFHTSGFCWKDMVNKNPQYPDSLRLDIDGFSKKLNDNNYFDVSFNTDILGFGFRFKEKNYLSFSIMMNVDARLNFSKGLFDLMVYGTDYPQHSIQVFDGKLMDATGYIAPTIAYSRVIDSNLTVGARLKFYNGIYNVHTNNSDVTMHFNDDNITATSDIDIRTSNAFMETKINSVTDEDSITTSDDMSNMVSNMLKNKGLGIDVGATYKIRPDMEISASIVDLGFIKWKSHAQNIKSKHPGREVNFSGVNTNYDSISNDINNYLDDMADSIKHSFDLESKDMNSYTTLMPTKIYLGYSWNFSGVNYLQALYKGRFIGGTYENSLMVAYACKLKYFYTSVGNTIASKFFNPNFMVSFSGFGINLYLGATINSSLNVASMNGFSMYGGFNIALGNRDNNKKDTERQIINIETNIEQK